ncbi:hypothetical protein ACFL5Z_09615 [Planctomycetota bacterium]
MARSKKKNTVTVVAWDKIKIGKLYKGTIKKAEVNNKHLHVIIENLDNSQLGRIHDVRLPMPVHPGSKTARFLVAVGQDAGTVGKQICLDEIVGAVVGMRFSSSDGSDKDIEFERIEPAVEDKLDDCVVDDGPEALM